MTPRYTHVPRRRAQPSASETSQEIIRRVPRAPIALAVALLLGAGLVAGDAERPLAPPAPGVSDPASMPPEGSQSSAWYCPGGPASGAVRVEAVVTATNLSGSDTVAAVTSMSSAGEVTSSEVTLPAHALVQLDPVKLSGEPHAALIVEPFSADVAVEQSLMVDGELEAGPCATHPSARWYFADGTTVRGAEQWLQLLNPFGDDAIVDVSFFTGEGLKVPQGLHGLEVPRRSSVEVKVHERVPRQDLVATVVAARVGRVIAEQSQIFLPDSGMRGVTASFGAVAPSVKWWFADGASSQGHTRWIGVANPGGYDTDVDVQVVADGDAVIEPVTVPVPRDSVVEVDLGRCGRRNAPRCIRVPNGLEYSVLVSSATDVPIVAQSIEQWSEEGGFTGATSIAGVREAADRWVFARSTVRGAERSSVAVLNPGSEPATVDLALVTASGVIEPADVQGIEILAGERRVIDILDLLDAAAPGDPDAGVLVESSAPVVAERFITRTLGATRTIGVPHRH